MGGGNKGVNSGTGDSVAGSGRSSRCRLEPALAQFWPPSVLPSRKTSHTTMIRPVFESGPSVPRTLAWPVEARDGLSRSMTPGGKSPPEMSRRSSCRP